MSDCLHTSCQHYSLYCLLDKYFFKSDLIGPQFLLPPTPAAHFIYTTGSGLPVLKAVLHHSLAKAFKVDINEYLWVI